jgi:hypothetical protein
MARPKKIGVTYYVPDSTRWCRMSLTVSELELIKNAITHLPLGIDKDAYRLLVRVKTILLTAPK